MNDNIAGRICRVMGCKRQRLMGSLYCNDHLGKAWYQHLPMKHRYTFCSVHGKAHA